MVGLIVDTDSRMTTRDGVPLAADVYRPADDACHPVLLHRTPYDRTNPTLVSALVADPVWLARRGYAVVVQDVRGRFGSGGEIDFFHQELDDGYDAVEWAAAQPWSDGNIGSYGSSYHAMTTFQAVAARPPHLRAALAMVGATDLAPTVRPGGLFELGFLATYALSHSVEALRRADLPGDERAAVLGRIATALADPVSAVTRLPLTGLDVLGDRAIAPFWSEWLDHEPGDPYWHRPTLAEHPDRVDVPLLQVVAFRDFMSSTAPDADVCATLVDIEPDGFAAGVSEGALRTRYRSGGVADWLAPGVVVELAVPLHQTAHTFRVGHRVRLEIAGANFPRLSRNLHTTVVPERGTEADAVIAEHTVHRPSRLVLHTVGRQLT